MKLAKWKGMAGRWAVIVGDEQTLRDVSVQTSIRRDVWVWGLRCIWYDGPHMAFGLGPLLLVAWDPWTMSGYLFARWLYEREDPA